ncbi:hypothetical protein BGZ99_002862, partial [Dissophora globulifera]
MSSLESKTHVVLDGKIPVEDAKEMMADERAYDNTSELDPIVVAKLRRKIDLHLIPLISVLYLCSFLDRVNIGNAKVAGLATNIGLGASEYNWALSIFFIG